MCRLGGIYKKKEGKFWCDVCGKKAGWFSSLFMMPKAYCIPMRPLITERKSK